MSLNASQAEDTVTLEPALAEAQGAPLLQVAADSSPAPVGRRGGARQRSSFERSIPIARGRIRRDGAVYATCKRILDLVAGSILLVIAMPVVLAAAAWIRFESRGSPFFFQTRLGKNGKPFRIFKLRGMYMDARQRFPELYDYSRNRDLEFHFHYNVDPRVTRAGQFLRRTSIDELPNLWNVVVGDMSLVGPRPEIPDILDMYGPYRGEYLSVKPGITCRSKIRGRDHLTKRETIELDLRYIRHRTFTRDLSILWTTILSVVNRRDVY